jgi:hypothetical protein
VFTRSPTPADPAPGPRPAPELARYDQKHPERAGPSAPATPPAPPGEALAVLAAVPERDGQLLSATQDRHRAQASADHLAILNAIWTAGTAPARQQRYQDLLQASLPPGHRQDPGHQARWLWRTLRAAELAGLDAGGVLAAQRHTFADKLADRQNLMIPGGLASWPMSAAGWPANRAPE